jgi:phosphate transport system substrate-binding protein
MVHVGIYREQRMKDLSLFRFVRSNRWLLHALVVGIALSGATAQAQAIKITGQNTLIFVGQKWKQFFAMDQPRLASSVVIDSGDGGMGALTSRSADVLQTTELLSTENALRIPVAIEAIVVYVNDSNPVKELSLAELKAIYTGSISNWKEVGGRDQRVELYAGESTTGIQDYFQHAILNGEESFYVGKTSTKALLETIATRPNAIGYASLGEAPGVHAISIRNAPHSFAVEPSTATIRDLQYPISRYVYWYVLRNATPAVHQFTQWIYSPHGQLVAESVGFFPLLPDDRKMSLAKLGLK